ncbi:MAG: hypothetical protein U9R04_02625 [Chloroflexota bacterium]|nr:hypothetical protein [Chloroflexota bacterium]
MPNGFGGRGFGRGGWGFGFRGSSPPWPYVGIGRGGLPRCGYFLSGAAAAPMTGYPYNTYPGTTAPYGVPYAGAAYPPDYPQTVPYGGAGAFAGPSPYSPPMTPEEELDFLRNQAQSIKGQLEQIDSRVKELGKEE